jgi:signal transduction histidine kinase
LVQTAVDDLAETGAKVALDPAHQEIAVIVEGDGIGLRRMVANLIDNSLKFGRSAKARVYQQDGEAVIEIDDDGPGLPLHELEAVFEPFHRGEPSRSRETGGAGLGLAVVRSVARAHGGDAHLTNLPGGGLRARVRLPLIDTIA